MVSGRQENAVVEFIDDFLQTIAQCDEIKDIIIFIQRSFHLRRDAPIVAMQALADVAVECNEVSSTEDQMIFRNANFPGFCRHKTSTRSTRD